MSTSMDMTFLKQYHNDVLKDMGELLGIDVHSNKKVAYVNALTAQLYEPETIRRGLALLSDREMRTVEFILRLEQNGGAAHHQDLRRILLRYQIVDIDEIDLRTSFGGASRGHNRNHDSYAIHAPEPRRNSFYSVIGRLIASGIVCATGMIPPSRSWESARSKVYYDNFALVFVPAQVAEMLPLAAFAGDTTGEMCGLGAFVQSGQRLAPDAVLETALGSNGTPGSARAFQRDLYLYWSTARSIPLNLTTQGRLYQKDLKRVNKSLQFPDDLEMQDEFQAHRLRFMRQLMTDIGILRVQGQEVYAVEHPQFLSQHPLVRVERTAKAWRQGRFWNELLTIPGLNAHDLPGPLQLVPDRIIEARETVIEHLVALHEHQAPTPTLQGEREDGWTRIDDLIDSLRMADYGFLLPRDYVIWDTPDGWRSPNRWKIDANPYSPYGNAMHWNLALNTRNEAEGWEVVENRFIRAVLVGPLHWMGLVNIGYTGDASHPTAYCLTPMGAWVLGLGLPPDIPSGEGKIVVQPNFDLLAIDPINDIALARLDAFAERLSAERALQYRLTRASVYKAQKRGWDSSRIISTLETMSGQPLPQNVARTVQEWQVMHERITIHRHATVLHAADQALLDTLRQTEMIQPYLDRQIGDRVCLLVSDGGGLEDLLRALHAHDHLPVVTAAPGTPSKMGKAPSAQPPSACLRILVTPSSLELAFRDPVPSIYLLIELDAFCERTPSDENDGAATGGYTLSITQASVQRALEQGQTIDAILNTLDRLHLGPLPDKAVTQVRTWGHYYDSVHVQAMVLVQVQDQQTLEAMRAEPELHDLLHPLKLDPDKAWAYVRKKDIELLRKSLRERGIEHGE